MTFDLLFARYKRCDQTNQTNAIAQWC